MQAKACNRAWAFACNWAWQELTASGQSGPKSIEARGTSITQDDGPVKWPDSFSGNQTDQSSEPASTRARISAARAANFV